MLRLQEVKADLADAALGDGNGARLNKMSVREIQTVSVFLFPFLRVASDPGQIAVRYEDIGTCVISVIIVVIYDSKVVCADRIFT